MTVQNGHAPDGTIDKVNGQDGGGIWIGSKDKVDINNCYIQNNVAGTGYGGVYLGNGGNGGGIYNLGLLTLTDCSLYDNTAGKGGSHYGDISGNNNGGNGGAICNIAAHTASSSLTIHHCKIENNTAGMNGTITPPPPPLPQIYKTGNTGNGGGIYSDSTLLINNTTIDNNKTCDVQGTSTELSGNAGAGGGLYIVNQYPEEIINIFSCTISDNTLGKGGESCSNFTKLHTGGTGGHGGGIAVRTISSGQLQNIKIRECEISNNKTGQGGIGPAMVPAKGGNGGSGGGIYIYEDPTVHYDQNITFKGNTIEHNATEAGGKGWTSQYNGTGGHGGGLYSNNSFSIDSSNHIENNTVASKDKDPNIYMG